jgi:hypothetical protein
MQLCDMTDQELIARFEQGAVPEDAFHHPDHVRLAFAYLRTYPTLAALARFSARLQEFAAAHGKANRYHVTITYAYFFLVNERLARFQGSDWNQFAKLNPDLLVWKNGILSRYYDHATLESDLARSTFLFPDKR